MTSIAFLSSPSVQASASHKGRGIINAWVIIRALHRTSSHRPQTMSSAADEAALARVYRPDTAINLSPPDNTAVQLSGEIRQYITSLLGVVRHPVKRPPSIDIIDTFLQDPEALLKLPVLSSPPIDDSHPIVDYFISFVSK